MNDDLQAKAERIGATKSQLFYAARNDTLIRDRYRITRTDTGIEVEDTKTIETDVLAGGREPGIYENMSDEEYHDGPGVSSSQLKAAMEGAPVMAGIPSEDKPAFVLGRQVHMAVLEPERWEALKSCKPPACPDKVREQGWHHKHHSAAKACADFFDGSTANLVALEVPPEPLAEVIDEAVGYKRDTNIRYAREALPLTKFYMEYGTDFEPVDDDTVEQVEAMRDSVLTHPDVDPAWFTEGRNELSLFWHEDTEAGTILCKARIDALVGARMFDLKTTRYASRYSFERDAVNFGYHVSASFYMRGIAQSSELQPVDDITLVAVEKSDPYLSCPHPLGHPMLAVGRELWTEALECVAAHLANPDAHAGYRSSGEPLEMPGWADKKARSKIDALRRRTQQLRQASDELPEALR